MLLLIWHLGSSGLGISHGGLLFFTFIYLLLWWYDMTLNNEMRIHTADPTYLDWGVVVVLLFGIKLHVPQLRSPVAAPLKLPLPSAASSITSSTCDLVQVILRTLNCDLVQFPFRLSVWNGKLIIELHLWMSCRTRLNIHLRLVNVDPIHAMPCRIFCITRFSVQLLLLKSRHIYWEYNCNLVANLAHLLCRSKGILFVAIDQSKPLSDQGPFDIVLHKVPIFYLF